MERETDSSALSYLGSSVASLARNASYADVAQSARVLLNPVSAHKPGLRESGTVGCDEAILECIGWAAGQDFERDFWKFVDWSQTDKAKQRGVLLPEH